MGIWVLSPFKWRAELEFGIKMPKSSSNFYGIYGPTRTLKVLGLNDNYEIGAVLNFKINTSDWEEMFAEIENKCNYPYKPEFDYSKKLKEKEELKFHMLFKDKNYGDYLFIDIKKEKDKYHLKLRTNWN